MRPYVYIDVETGGYDPGQDSILSIGLIVVNDLGQVIDSYYALICEDAITISAKDGALAVNGLTVEKVRRDGHSPLEVVVSITSLLARYGLNKDVLIAAHKASFDYGFLRRLWRMAGRGPEFETLFSHRLLCSQASALLLDLAGVIELPEGKSSLAALAILLDVSLNRSAGHNALDDARAGVTVLEKLLAHIRKDRHERPRCSI